jgi:hypothetical protein
MVRKGSRVRVSSWAFSRKSAKKRYFGACGINVDAGVIPDWLRFGCDAQAEQRGKHFFTRCIRHIPPLEPLALA